MCVGLGLKCVLEFRILDNNILPKFNARDKTQKWPIFLLSCLPDVDNEATRMIRNGLCRIAYKTSILETKPLCKLI